MAQRRSTLRPAILAGLAGMFPCVLIVVGYDLPHTANVVILALAAFAGIACFLGARFLLGQ